MSHLSLVTALSGALVIVAGLLWRFGRSHIRRTTTPDPAPLTRAEVWQHAQALAEHFRACVTDQVMIALNEFVCQHESPTHEV